MTTTLAEVRLETRRRLEDTSGSPLWGDADIDDGLRASLGEYSQWEREEARLVAVVEAGDRSIPLPGAIFRVTRVTGPAGRVIPRRAGEAVRSVSDEEVSWEPWAGELTFTQSLIAGDYEIRYLTARSMPSEASAAFPVRDEDIPLIVSGAVLRCLERRSLEDWKRGALPPRHDLVLRRAAMTYEREWDARRRVVRTSFVRGDG